MRLGIFLIFVLLFVCGAFASDFSSELLQESYAPHEAVSARLNFGVDLYQDLTSADVSVYSAEGQKLALTKKLDKIDDTDYYFSFILPQVANGEYKIFLDNIKYIKNDQLKASDFEVGFTVEDRAEVLQVWPPIWFDEFDNAFNPKIDLKVKNVGNNLSHLEIMDEGSLLSMISPTSSNMLPNILHWIQLRTTIPDYNKGFHSTSVVFDYGNDTFTLPVVFRKKFYSGEYDVPIYKEVEVNVTETKELVNVTVETNVTAVNDTLVNITSLNNTNFTGDLKFTYPFEGEIVSSVESEEPVTITPLFKNPGDVVVTDLQVSFTNDLEEVIEYKLLSTAVKPGESESIDLIIDPSKAKVDRYIGELVITSSEGVEARMKVDLTFFIQGTQTVNQSVTQDLIVDDPGQFGATEPEEEPSYLGWVIILVALIVVGALGYVFYKKGQKKEKEFGTFIDSVKRR